MTQIELNSYAKINLGLQVLNKRPDGYHNINTVFAKISLCDNLKFTKNNSGKIKLISNVQIPYDNNLIIKAANSLKQKYFRGFSGVDIELKKSIPIGGGLGGGSSNAAYTILALNELFNLNIDKSHKDHIASFLGSDVSFFMNKGAAIGTGKGDLLSFFDLRTNWYVLVVNPNINISTVEAYSLLKRKHSVDEKIDFAEIIKQSLHEKSILKDHIINDFEEPIFKSYNLINKVKEKLYETGAFFALMSGSGSSVFGLFDDPEVAKESAAQFKKYFTSIVRIIN